MKIEETHLLVFLVPELHLGTRLPRQFHCRSRYDHIRLGQREMKFRGNKERSQVQLGNEVGK